MSQRDTPEGRAAYNDYMRKYYRTNRKQQLRGLMRGRWTSRIMSKAEIKAASICKALQLAIDRFDLNNIRMAICRKCGNHRIYNPDREGRCAQCLATKRKRLRASPSARLVRRLAKHRRIVRIRGNGGELTTMEWKVLCSFYGSKCLCCGASDERLTIDHVIPLSLGGRHEAANVQPLCHYCNSVKSDRTIDYRPS